MKTFSNKKVKKLFEEVFKEYFPILCNFAQKFVFDSKIAEDIVHEIFLKLWEKRDTIDFDKSLKSYLYTSVNNRCLNYIRDNKKFVGNDYLEEVNESVEKSAEDILNEVELEQNIKVAIDRLPEKCKRIFLLVKFEDLKYREVAEKLDISVKTVEAQMTKALKNLRGSLINYLKFIILVFIIQF